MNEYLLTRGGCGRGCAIHIVMDSFISIVMRHKALFCLSRYFASLRSAPGDFVAGFDGDNPCGVFPQMRGFVCKTTEAIIVAEGS